MTERRVVVTGMGAVTPLGITRNKEGKNEFWENMIKGKKVIKNITLKGAAEVFDRIKGAEISGWNIGDYLEPNLADEKRIRKLQRFDKMIQYAIVATKLSLEDASLMDYSGKNEIGFYTGNAMQGIGAIEEMVVEQMKKYAVLFGEHLTSELSAFSDLSLENGNGSIIKNLEDILDSKVKKLKEKGIYDFDGISPFSLFKTIPPSIFNFVNYAISGQVSEFFKLNGPSLAVNSACAAGSDAIGNAYRVIKDDDANIIVAGGSEAPIAYSIISMFNNLKVMSKNGVKPGDKERDGFALGEGAGYLVLEELKHALSRKAKIYSELVGYSQTNDGYSMIMLEPEGKFVEVAIRKVIKKAGLTTGDIDYIKPHCTSTQECDSVESKILRRVFGSHLEEMIVHPVKCLTGHFQAGAGAVEAVLTNLIFEKDFIPGIPKQDNPDPQCLKYVPEKGMARKINTALSIAMGFGGHNSALLFKRYS